VASTWTRVTNPDDAAKLLPAWLGTRMIGLSGTFGLLLSHGDVLRCTVITAVHQSSDGIILLDVLLDNAGVPHGVDEAWRSKHYLGTPVPAATLATVNLAHVVAAVEFVAAEMAELSIIQSISRLGEAEREVELIVADPEAAVRLT
jgi:hypothetical protein